MLAHLNRVLYQGYRNQSHRHCTVIFGILTPTETGYSATIAGGGHPAPMLLRTDGTIEAQATTGGTLIGGLRTPRIVTRTFLLAAGDTLILYSDGLTEARSGPDADRYGEDALQTFLTRLAPTTTPTAIEALTGLLDTLERLDDVALMALSLDKAAREVTTGG